MQHQITPTKPIFEPIEVVLKLETFADLAELRGRLNRIPPISSRADAVTAHVDFGVLWGAIDDLYQKRKWA